MTKYKEINNEEIQEQKMDYYRDYQYGQIKEQLTPWIEVKETNTDTEYWDCTITDTTILANDVLTVITLGSLTTNTTMTFASNQVTINKDWRYTVNFSWYFKTWWAWDKRQVRIRVNWWTKAWDYRVPRSTWTFISISWTWSISAWDYIDITGENNDTSNRTFVWISLNITKI